MDTPMNKTEAATSAICRHRKPWDICGICNPIVKTEAALAAIFRHCDEVAEGKRQPRSEREGSQVALTWLGVNKELTGASPVQR